MPATTRPVTTQARTYATYYMVDVNGQRGHDQVLFHHPNGLCVVCLSERHPMCTDGDTTSRDRGGPSTGGGEKRKREDGAEDAGIAGAADAGGAAETAEGGSEGGQQAETETAPLPAAAPGVVASYGAVAEADFSCGKGKGHQTNAAVSGKHKRGAKLLMENSGVVRLVDVGGKQWTARACVKGKLLEVNERLLSEPHLASDAPTQEGFLAIIMPRPEDVQKLRKLALSPEEYRALRSVDNQ